MYSFHVQFTGTNYCPSFQLQTSPHLRRLITIETAPKKKEVSKVKDILPATWQTKATQKKKNLCSPRIQQGMSLYNGKNIGSNPNLEMGYPKTSYFILACWWFFTNPTWKNDARQMGENLPQIEEKIKKYQKIFELPPPSFGNTVFQVRPNHSFKWRYRVFSPCCRF